MNPTGKIPVVELNGQVLTQSYPMLRHFARLLGQYDGETEEEKYRPFAPPPSPTFHFHYLLHV